MTRSKSDCDELILDHPDGLYHLARWLTRNPDDAQDLVQETALKTIKERNQFRGGTSLTALAV